MSRLHEPTMLTSGKEAHQTKRPKIVDWLYEYEVEKLNSNVSINIRGYTLSVPVLWNEDVYMTERGMMERGMKESKQCKLLRYSITSDSWSDYVLPCTCDAKTRSHEQLHVLTTYDSKLLLINGPDKEVDKRSMWMFDATEPSFKVWEFDAAECTFKPSPDITPPQSIRIQFECIEAASKSGYLIICGKTTDDCRRRTMLYDGKTWVICDCPNLSSQTTDLQVVIHNHSVFLIEKLPGHEVLLIYKAFLQSFIDNEPDPWQLLKSTMKFQLWHTSNFFALETHLSIVSHDCKPFGEPYANLRVWHYHVNSESWREAGLGRVPSTWYYGTKLCAVGLPDESLMIIWCDYTTLVYKLKPKKQAYGQQKLTSSLETHTLRYVSTWKDMPSLKPQQQHECGQSKKYKSGVNKELSKEPSKSYLLQPNKPEEELELSKEPSKSYLLQPNKPEEELGPKTVAVARVAAVFAFLTIMLTFATSYKISSSQAVFSPYNPASEEHQSAPPGIQFLYLRTHSIIRSPTTQTIALRKFGILLHVPPNITFEPLLKITIGVSLSGSVTLPHNNMSLVSAMYYIKVFSKLLQPITVELQHCVTILNSSSISSMKFGKAKSENYWFIPPYHFEMLPEGKFTVGKSWGTIKMSHFCLLGIFWCNDIPPSISYLAGVLSYQQVHRKLGSHKMLLLTGRNLAVNKEMIRKEFSEWTQIVQWFSFKFVNESETLSLNISENGDVSGHWKIQAIVSPPKISKSEIDFHNVILCELRASWMNKNEGEGAFEHTLSMSGIDKRSVTIIIDEQGRDQDYCNRQESILHHNEIKNFHDLFHAVANISNWRGLCVNLHVELGTIDAIARSGEAVVNKKYTCLESFFNTGNATWEAVIEAVAKYPVNNRRVAQEIANKQHIDMEF